MSASTPGQQLFAAIKQTARAGEPGLLLPVGQPLAAVVRPIATVPGHTDAVDVRLLTEWRNRHVKSFLTEFKDKETSSYIYYIIRFMNKTVEELNLS